MCLSAGYISGEEGPLSLILKEALQGLAGLWEAESARGKDGNQAPRGVYQVGKGRVAGCEREGMPRAVVLDTSRAG